MVSGLCFAGLLSVSNSDVNKNHLRGLLHFVDASLDRPIKMSENAAWKLHFKQIPKEILIQGVSAMAP